jgi:hypothetical protein
LGFPLSVICSGRPIELDKLNILALAAETGILLFKEQVPLKFKKEISAVQCERKSFQLISLSTPVSFRWTVPLNPDNFIGYKCWLWRIFPRNRCAQLQPVSSLFLLLKINFEKSFGCNKTK